MDLVSGRSYRQYCGLAKALDLVGERWTLLIVRDLALEPRRYGELLDGLPGIGTSLLSERLQHLEELGVVERTAAPRPLGGLRYRLTPHGKELARAIAPLTAWGASHLDPRDQHEFKPDWLGFTMRSAFRPQSAAGVHDCYQIRLPDDVSVWITVDDGRLDVTSQRPCDPDFVVETDLATLAQLGSGLLGPEEASASGRAKFEGDAEAGWRMLRLFGSGASTATAAVARQ